MTPLRDSSGRSVSYLRVSVTDRCDFRSAFIGLGVRKARLTGAAVFKRACAAL